MDARRDALAHRFIARTANETAAWSPALQVALHELAFVALPELVLGLDTEAARLWVRAWHDRMTAPPVAVDAADAEWVGALATEWLASRRLASRDDNASPAEIARLADLFARLGPLALGLPWRDESITA